MIWKIAIGVLISVLSIFTLVGYKGGSEGVDSAWKIVLSERIEI